MIPKSRIEKISQGKKVNENFPRKFYDIGNLSWIVLLMVKTGILYATYCFIVNCQLV